ncbi:protein kinase domain-containing protein, partial [Thiolapillus sp.]
MTSNKSLLSLSSHHFSTLHHKHIRQEDIAQEESIGRGGFGSVYRGTYRGTAVACKSFHSHTDDTIVRETYDRELKALELDLKHDNIVTLLGATSTLGWEEGACIVMEYAGGVSLQSYLKDESKHIPFEHSLFFLCDILQGVSYLHSRNVIHLDLKPANFILSVGPVVRICDFGTVHVVGQPWQSQIAGTVAFRAPELFIGGNPTFASDIYSLGFVMWCFDTRLFPFAGESRDYIISLCVD